MGIKAVGGLQRRLQANTAADHRRGEEGVRDA